MQKGEFTASVFQGALLGEGDHIVKIESVQHTEAAASPLYKDRTPQLAVKFKNNDGVFTNWYNMQGYAKFDELTAKQQKSGQFEPRGDESYAVEIKTGNRVPSPEKTASALSIIGQLGTNALALPEGAAFNGGDLVGEQVGIHIAKNDRGKLRVTYSMPADKVTA